MNVSKSNNPDLFNDSPALRETQEGYRTTFEWRQATITRMGVYRTFYPELFERLKIPIEFTHISNEALGSLFMEVSRTVIALDSLDARHKELVRNSTFAVANDENYKTTA
ncbi:MAG: hypothetical protein LBQ24_01135 [Candidatus Peribacteria bacterium]|jgi:hypothetical protein|nr:hypothetical protein [Candidatus Peribacteria bacterium]